MPLIAAHEIDIESADEAIYNGLDNCTTFEIDEVRQRSKRKADLIYSFERAMQGPALEMMLRGFRVDISERETTIGILKSKMESLHNLLRHIIEASGGEYLLTFPRSSKQLTNLFYTRMKLKKITQYVDGELKFPMDRLTLEKLATRNIWAETIVNAVLLFRDISKNTQVLETEIDRDWRWRYSFNIAATPTGRWSSSKSPFGTGNNIQNITEELRRVFIPDPGYVLYGIDKAQSESRDVGWFCGTILDDWSYLDACESGDLHTYVTRLVYPDWDWTGDLKKDRALAERKFYRAHTYRDANKRLGHGTNYMGTPKEMARQTRIPQNLVEDFRDRYLTAFPCISEMHKWIAQKIQRDKYLINSFGHRRDFFGRTTDNETIKSAVAHMFQSATAHCTKLGIWRLWNRLGNKGVELLTDLHDAIYFQTRDRGFDSDERYILSEAIDCMQITQRDPKTGRTMTIPAEASRGFNWAHRFRISEDGTKEDWNPQGLEGVKL